jgi:hypothetical protein
MSLSLDSDSDNCVRDDWEQFQSCFFEASLPSLKRVLLSIIDLDESGEDTCLDILRYICPNLTKLEIECSTPPWNHSIYANAISNIFVSDIETSITAVELASLFT